jgi:hypothetical protein
MCVLLARVGVLQIGGAVGGPARVARVAVLIGRVTLGAAALHEAIGEEAAVLRILQLLDLLGGEMAALLERLIDARSVRRVLVRVRAAVAAVELDVETREGLAMALARRRRIRVRRRAALHGRDLDGRTVAVSATYAQHVLACHAHGAHVGGDLHVLDEVSEVDGAVRVRKGGGDEDAAVLLCHARACGRGAGPTQQGS